jgi:2-dehydro-3-deoxyphosphogalactonate aldolase
MTLKAWLHRSPLIAILRGVKPSEVESIGAALEEAGIAIVEVPLNSPEPLKSIELLSQSFGDRMLIGAGTLTNASQVESVASAGGRLIVTPHADVAIVRAAKAAGLTAVPGFFNPTEAFALLQAGADGIKLFPADVLGPAMLKAMRAVLPKDAIVIPVGGVGAAQIPAWLSAGAQGFGLGSSLYKPGDNSEAVKAKAKALVAVLGSHDSSYQVSS